MQKYEATLQLYIIIKAHSIQERKKKSKETKPELVQVNYIIYYEEGPALGTIPDLGPCYRPYACA